ncbi:flavodoxin family protein [Marinobacter sp. 1Y8]
MTEQRKKLLVVAHAPSPNTLTLRDAVARGAAHSEIEAVDVTVLAPLDAGPEDVLACDAIILGTTENLGYMSGALKDFFDRSYYPCLEKTQGLPFAFYIRAGHDGTGTQRAIESITTGLRWRLVQDPLLCRGDYQDAFEAQCEKLGLYVSASLDAGLF